MLSPSDFPEAQRAADLEAQLFGGGTEFLKLDYDAQSTRMAAILQRIDGDGLVEQIDDVAGPELLKAIRGVQPRYEAMVTERLRRDSATGQNLSESARALQGAIVNYATKVIGTIEHDEPETTEAARLALLPIANFREAAAGRAQKAPAKPEPG